MKCVSGQNKRGSPASRLWCCAAGASFRLKETEIFLLRFFPRERRDN